MKAFFNGIEIEGTLNEIQAIVYLFNSENLIKPKTLEKLKTLDTSTVISTNKYIYPKQKDVIKNLLTNIENFVPAKQNSYVFPEVEAFVKELYRYRADRSSPLGRAPYAIKLLATGESYTMKRLIALTNSNTSTVSNAIKRAADAGCVIQVTGASKNLNRNTKIKMISLGTPEQAKQVRLSLAPSKDPRTAQYKMRYKAITQSANGEATNRNSPPIVKINHTN